MTTVLDASSQAALLDDLRGVVGDRVTANDAARDAHAQDESALAPERPDLVAFPATTLETARIVGICHQRRVPVVAWGAGTSLEGHVLATRGGVSLDLSRMDNILAINTADFDVRVQAGVRKDQLNQALRGHGLFFAVDPGADPTLGGMAATAASGTMTVRYGTMRETVLALEVVLADGTVIRTGSRARKSAAGYDLTHLFVGSEGTLGVITELVVRVFGVPERVASAVASFPSMHNAVSCATAILQAGVPIARCEFVDQAGMRAVNAYSRLDEPESPTLFFEFHGTDASVGEQMDTVRMVAGEFDAERIRVASRTEEQSRLWTARHDAFFAVRASRPASRVVTTDACVPLSVLDQCVDDTATDAASLPFPVICLGHVADGNFHCLLVIDPADAAERDAAEAFTSRLAQRAISVGGSVSGEHGVGLNKRRWLERQYGANAVELMRTLKRTLDPHMILNPDKVVTLDAAATTRRTTATLDR